MMKLLTSFGFLLLGAAMLRADVQRIEIDSVEDWTIRRCADGEKSAGTGMHRAFPSKPEIHLRLRIMEAGSGELDAMNSEIVISHLDFDNSAPLCSLSPPQNPSPRYIQRLFSYINDSRI